MTETLDRVGAHEAQGLPPESSAIRDVALRLDADPATAGPPRSVATRGESIRRFLREHSQRRRVGRADQSRSVLQSFFGVTATAQGLLFVYPGDLGGRIAVAGDFNDWSPTATPLCFDSALYIWQRCLPVADGQYRYRLVVDGQWRTDRCNGYVEANPFGELNNVVTYPGR